MTIPKAQTSRVLYLPEEKADVQEYKPHVSIMQSDTGSSISISTKEDISKDLTDEKATITEQELERSNVNAGDEEEILYDLTEEEHGNHEHAKDKPVVTNSPKSRSPSLHDEQQAQTSPITALETSTSASPEPYIETDPLMGSLADHMDKAMGFTVPAVTNVKIRRGYEFDLEVTGSEFWTLHNNAPRGTKRKHEEEEAMQRHGFLAEDIIDSGAIQLPGARYPGLTNDVHPLFQRDAFDGCEDDVYEQFLPALRLASMFLTQPICSQFWVTLALGERFVDEKMTARIGKLQHRIPRDMQSSIENATKVIEYIKSIANEYRVHFTFVQRMMAGGVKWAGLTQKVENYSCEVEWSSTQKPKSLASDLLRIHTRLSSDWYVAAKKLSKIKFPDTAQLLRFNFGFAVLITHEICHAIELAHIRKRPEWVPDSSWNIEMQQEIGHEPFFHNIHVPELGYTWEKYVFGGKVWPINDRMDCLHGLCITDWPVRSVDIWDSSKVEYYTIPMKYIEPLFQMKTWEQNFDISDTKVWHIPRSGAKSIYLHSFTTMDFNEEQRIKDEEMEELRAEQERKPPASKKRRTSIKDQDNAVPLSSTGNQSLPKTEEEVGEPPAQTPTATSHELTLAQRPFNTPKSARRKRQGKAKSDSKTQFEGTNAQQAARKVGLGSGKRR